MVGSLLRVRDSYTDIRRMAALARLRFATLDDHWQGGTIAVMLRYTEAGYIGAPRAG
jgi:hypothetical protein